jgi:hypothetical protein
VASAADAAAAEHARAALRDMYEAKGSNAGMAAFVAMTSWQGEFTEEYFTQTGAGSRPVRNADHRTAAWAAGDACRRC